MAKIRSRFAPAEKCPTCGEVLQVQGGHVQKPWPCIVCKKPICGGCYIPHGERNHNLYTACIHGNPACESCVWHDTLLHMST